MVFSIFPACFLKDLERNLAHPETGLIFAATAETELTGKQTRTKPIMRRKSKFARRGCGRVEYR